MPGKATKKAATPLDEGATQKVDDFLGGYRQLNPDFTEARKMLADLLGEGSPGFNISNGCLVTVENGAFQGLTLYGPAENGDQKLRNCPPMGLEELGLISQRLTTEGCQSLAPLIQAESLQKLTLDLNDLQQGLPCLVSALQNKGIRQLSLAYCGLTQMSPLRDLLIHHKCQLEILNLRGNFLGAQMPDILRAASHSKLRSLDISSNGLEESPELLAGFQYLLTKNRELTTLDVSHNECSLNFWAEAFKGLATTSLASLILPNHLSADGIDALLKDLPKKKTTAAKKKL